MSEPRSYRGITKDGKWVESYDILRRQDWDEKKGWTTRYFLQDGYSCNEMPKIENFVEVIPETVSQSTGLKDKNGKEIFEGDIFCYTRTKWQCPNHPMNNKDIKEKVRVYWSDENHAFYIDVYDDERCYCSGYLSFNDNRAKENIIEIIGSIHDQLLK